MQFVINIFAKDAKIKKLEVAKCNIIKKGMMQGNVAWKNSGTEWEKIRTFVLNVYFMDL
jgi:hypothetical protein